MPEAEVAAVLDASALMAVLHDEDGADAAAEAIANGAAISVANWAEVLTKLAERGRDPSGQQPKPVRPRGPGERCRLSP